MWVILSHFSLKLSSCLSFDVVPSQNLDLRNGPNTHSTSYVRSSNVRKHIRYLDLELQMRLPPGVVNIMALMRLLSLVRCPRKINTLSSEVVRYGAHQKDPSINRL